MWKGGGRWTHQPYQHPQSMFFPTGFSQWRDISSISLQPPFTTTAMLMRLAAEVYTASALAPSALTITASFKKHPAHQPCPPTPGMTGGIANQEWFKEKGDHIPMSQKWIIFKSFIKEKVCRKGSKSVFNPYVSNIHLTAIPFVINNGYHYRTTTGDNVFIMAWTTALLYTWQLVISRRSTFWYCCVPFTTIDSQQSRGSDWSFRWTPPGRRVIKAAWRQKYSSWWWYIPPELAKDSLWQKTGFHDWVT